MGKQLEDFGNLHLLFVSLIDLVAINSAEEILNFIEGKRGINTAESNYHVVLGNNNSSLSAKLA